MRYSSKISLARRLPKIIGAQHTFKVISYRGIGHIPASLVSSTNAGHRLLLAQLPKLLRGYGKTFTQYPANYPAAVIVVCDLDDKCLKALRRELLGVLNACNPKPATRFCIAIEEGEAWLLGDYSALKAAYPKAKDEVLSGYENDSICGTWELLADAVCTGGAEVLKNKGWQSVGREKSTWSERIAPQMNVHNNASPSFRYFRETLRELTEHLR